MPKKGYNKRLTDEDVIRLFESGRYSIDPDTGDVYGKDKTEPLYTFVGGYKQRQRWVRLYEKPAMRSLPRSWCIWLAMAKHPVPDDFEIHHRNTDETDDRWTNLFCLFRLDHSKLHNGHGEPGDLIESTPF